MKDTLVALNIIINDKIINKNGVPILFYWNGQSSSLIKDIYGDENFKSLLYNSVIFSLKMPFAQVWFCQYQKSRKKHDNS